MKLTANFYNRNTLQVAKDLLGMSLFRQEKGKIKIGRIVEVEAYMGPQDLASHSSKGHTARTETMFGPPGRAYVYMIYGVWNCLNVVTKDEGIPHAVLIRALEPVENLEGKTWGPGLLCRAMNIDRRLNGEDLEGNRLWIEKPPRVNKIKIARATRIGVDYAGEWAKKPWRFYDASSAYVSTAPAKEARGRTKAPQ